MRNQTSRSTTATTIVPGGTAFFFLPSIVVVLMFCGSAAAGPSKAEIPLGFEANHGQWREDVRFVARGRAGLVILSRDGQIQLVGEAPGDVVRITFPGSGAPREIEGEHPLAQRHHYWIGADAENWRHGVPVYGRVVARELYPATDLLLRSDDGGELEYDFVVRPGADPAKIRIRFDGASVSLDPDGGLLVTTPQRSVRMRAPVLYQQNGEERSVVEGRYRMVRRGTVGFSVGAYDRSRDLVIDPVILGYSTFLGGTDNEFVSAIAVDGDRNTWVAGATSSPSFPVTGGVRSGTPGVRDVFLARLSPAGDQVLSIAFIGGSNHDAANAIAVDPQGNIYLTGSTSSPNFPVTGGAPQTTLGGGSDAFVAKVSGDGSALLFSTYFGGEGDDSGHGVAPDSFGDILVAGRTQSSQLPVTESAFRRSRPGMRDGFVARLRVDPPSLVFSTYIGGSDDDILRGLATDAAGAAYVVGSTLSPDFPTTAGSLQPQYGGPGSGNQRFGDVFVTKVAPGGDALLWSTYIGGSSAEIGNAITVDAAGSARVAGIAFFTGFPTTEGAFQPRHAGGQADAFVLALSPEGDRLVFSTYLGGAQDSGNEEAFAIALDPLGNAHVTGSTLSSDFPTTQDAVSRQKKGLIDGFVSVVSRDGAQLLYSSYLGGTAPSGGPQENAWAVAADSAGNTYVGGQTRSADFPVTSSSVQQAYRGLDDGFVMKLVPERARPEGEMRVVAVAGSTAGALGSYFKTSFQLHNPGSTTISGRFVFRPQGTAGAGGDGSLDYFIRPGETVAFSDLLPAMGRSGLGSVDLFTPFGEVPDSFIRIFNDAGAAGTTGMSLEPIAPERALAAGMTGILVAPSAERARFNIGVRSLETGASLTITVRRSDGSVAHTATRTYEPHVFEQRNGSEFAGVSLAGDDSIAVRVDSGSAIVYGSTTDNITQDPSLQVARALDSVAGEMRVIPVVGSTQGALGSYFKTSVQLHNASSEPISGRIVYHALNAPGNASDPALPYSIGPRQTISFQDLLPAMGLAGLGSVDLISTAGPLPVSVVRIYNDAGERGTTGMSEEQVALGEALRAGDEGVLIAPADAARARFNIGIRTLGEGVVLSATLRNALGVVVKTVTKEYAPVFFTQIPASALVETELRGNDSIRFRIEKGSAVIYGATTDNRTQDPALKIVRRLQ